MKKIILILFMLLVLVGLAYAQQCTDTDGGIDYYVRGTVVDISGYSHTDECSSSRELVEYFCHSSGYYGADFHTCPFGLDCVDGVCGGIVTTTTIPTEPECTPGFWKCENGNLYKCVSNQQWAFLDTCSGFDSDYVDVCLTSSPRLNTDYLCKKRTVTTTTTPTTVPTTIPTTTTTIPLPECVTDADCEEGKICKDNKCVAKFPLGTILIILLIFGVIIWFILRKKKKVTKKKKR